MIPPLQAFDIISSIVPERELISLPLLQSKGYTLAQDINADRDYPPFNRAAMDGYAFRFSDVTKDGDTLPLDGRLLAGDAPDSILFQGGCIRIMTGCAVPGSCDTIIRVEDTEVEGNDIIFHKLPREKANIARNGEDSTTGQVLLSEGTVMDPATIALCACVGVTQLKVYRPLKVAIITTGNEVVAPNSHPLPHQIRDSNSIWLQIFCSSLGAEVVAHSLCRDDRKEITDTIQSFLSQADVLMLCGGVSAGEADMVPQCLADAGVTCLFHRVGIKPGGPFWFGSHGKKPVFAFPGNPLSVQVTSTVFAAPILKPQKWSLLQTDLYPLDGNYKNVSKLTHLVPAVLVSTDGKTTAEPKKYNGSGDITALLHTDGLLVMNPREAPYEIGEVVPFIPFPA